MEHVAGYSTAYGLREAESHPVHHPPRASEFVVKGGGEVVHSMFVCLSVANRAYTSCPEKTAPLNKML